MRLQHRSLTLLAMPLKALVDRFAFGALVLLSIALLAVGRANLPLLEGIGTRIGDAFVPALGALVQSITSSRRLVEQLGELVALRAENSRLREENLRLLEWQSAARQLSLENAALRQLLSMPAGPERPTAVTGRVIADTGGPFVHTVLLDIGTEHGASRGMAAVNERGLVGRVIEAGRRSSRVLLLTDFNSRIPVMIEPARDQAILAGNNSGQPTLVFLPINPRLALGDLVVTSGRDGVLPPGLEVGRVRSIHDAGVAVEPLVDFTRLEYLRLLEYDNVVPPEQLEELQQEIYGPPLPPGFRPIEGSPTSDPAVGSAGPLDVLPEAAP